jgi:hypothetical protein
VEFFRKHIIDFCDLKKLLPSDVLAGVEVSLRDEVFFTARPFLACADDALTDGDGVLRQAGAGQLGATGTHSQA